MAHGRGRKGAEELEQPRNTPVQPPAANTAKNRQPWYELAREGAQIIVSALALYASAKGFARKIKERREA